MPHCPPPHRTTFVIDIARPVTEVTGRGNPHPLSLIKGPCVVKLARRRQRGCHPRKIVYIIKTATIKET